jgi:hypothetical protein
MVTADHRPHAQTARRRPHGVALRTVAYLEEPSTRLIFLPPCPRPGRDRPWQSFWYDCYAFVTELHQSTLSVRPPCPAHCGPGGWKRALRSCGFRP